MFFSYRGDGKNLVHFGWNQKGSPSLPPEKKEKKSYSSVVKIYLKVVSKMEFMTAKCQVKVFLIL